VVYTVALLLSRQHWSSKPVQNGCSGTRFSSAMRSSRFNKPAMCFDIVAVEKNDRIGALQQKSVELIPRNTYIFGW